MRPRLSYAGLGIKALGCVLFLVIVNGISSFYLQLHRNRKSIKSVLTNVLPNQSSDPNIDLAGTYKNIFNKAQSNWKGNDPLLEIGRSTVQKKSESIKFTKDIRLETADNFTEKMQYAQIPIYPWTDDRFSDKPWLDHSVSWWNYTNRIAISKTTLEDMRRSPNTYYGTIAHNFENGIYLAAAKHFSPFALGVDSWPGVAVFENAVVFAEGQVHNRSFLVQGKACGPSHPVGFPDIVPQHFRVVATIAHFWGQGYYHFVAENFVRLPLILQVIEKCNYSMLHVNSRPPFVTTLLHLVGVDRKQVIEGVVAADLVFLPEPVPCGNPSALMLNLLRRTLFEKRLGYMMKSNAADCKILLLERKSSRAIKNHGELVSRLSTAFNFCTVSVHTGEESVLNQLRLFQSSSTVVAPHGAGLVNMVACREKTLILELMVSGKDVNICYMAMAYKLRLHHVMLTVQGATQGSQMNVDVAQTIALLLKVQPNHAARTLSLP